MFNSLAKKVSTLTVDDGMCHSASGVTTDLADPAMRGARGHADRAHEQHAGFFLSKFRYWHKTSSVVCLSVDCDASVL